MLPIITRKKPNPKTVDRFEKGMEKVLFDIENIWLEKGKKNYLCGDNISVADIIAVCELEQPSMAGYDVRQDHPILAKYMDRVKADLQPHYDDTHKILYKIRDKFQGERPNLISFAFWMTIFYML